MTSKKGDVMSVPFDEEATVLKPMVPTRKPSAYPNLKLNDTHALLGPEGSEQLTRDLESLARSRKSPPDIGVN